MRAKTRGYGSWRTAGRKIKLNVSGIAEGQKPPAMTTKEAWASRLAAEYDAGNLTIHWRAVLLVLLTFRGHGGRIYPSHQGIADRVTERYFKCCARTVERALHAARDLGLLFWLPQHRREGWRKLRSSNLYFINVPAGPAKPGPKRIWPRYSTDRQAVFVQGQEVSERLTGGGAAVDNSGRNLLAARAQAFRAQQIAALAGRCLV